MTRRASLLLLAAARLRADESQEIWDLFAQLASALSEGNADTFLRAFDKAMPGYGMLEANIRALVDQADVQSSIAVLSDEGTAAERKVELDWILVIVAKQPAGGSDRRREHVRCGVAKQGKRWRITSLEPAPFFTPPATR